jgi:Tfp pilus assembly protein PilF
MTSQRLTRGLLLFEQGRYEQAERELRGALAEDVENATAHRLLALCLLNREQYDDAQRECRMAIHLEPLDADNHLAMGALLIERGRLDDARLCIDEALRLDPAEVHGHALSARVHLEKSRWAEALASAEHGLRLDPENVDCVNLRAQALVKLGRRAEAGLTLDSALRRDPEDASTHANLGWTLLESGEPRRAMEHFREALRLEPGNDWARSGIIESMKARNILYRGLLSWFFWLSRFSPQTQWVILIGMFLGQQAIARWAAASPGLAPVLYTVLIGMLLFAISTWLASPLFNLVLWTDRFGRYALSDDERRGASTVALFLLSALALAVTGLFTADPVTSVGALHLAAATIPASVIHRCTAGQRRWSMFAVTAVVAGMAVVPVVAYHLADNHLLAVPTAVGMIKWTLANFIYAFIASQFLGNGLVMAPERK